MQAETRHLLMEAGIDLEDAMDRFFDDEELFMSVVKMFLEDPNYGLYKEAMEKKSFEDAFKAMHTLKGLCGNLSLIPLFEVTSREVELLRSEKYPEAEELMPELDREYNKVFEALQKV